MLTCWAAAVTRTRARVARVEIMLSAVSAGLCVPQVRWLALTELHI